MFGYYCPFGYKVTAERGMGGGGGAESNPPLTPSVMEPPKTLVVIG